MSKKNPATFFDVKLFNRAAEMPSGVLSDNTGCLFLKRIDAIFSQLLIFLG
jgi:hypothetical protein